MMDDNGIEVGDTMSVDEFFAAADTSKPLGFRPSLLVTARDSRGHRRSRIHCSAWPGRKLTVPCSVARLLGRSGVREAAETYAKMLDYVNEDFSALVWSDAIALVIEGKAGFNSMGDWAYGEVLAKDAQDNIGWVSHPGSDGSFVLVVDSFSLCRSGRRIQRTRGTGSSPLARRKRKRHSIR